MLKACIFVDGENFRYSLTQLFSSKRFHFHRDRYLPTADWYDFFRWVAEQLECDLLRTYWYVTDSVDFRPWQVPYSWKEKIHVFARSNELRIRIEKAKGEIERHDVLKQIESELDARRKVIEARWRSQRDILFAVESSNDRTEIRRVRNFPAARGGWMPPSIAGARLLSQKCLRA